MDSEIIKKISQQIKLLFKEKGDLFILKVSSKEYNEYLEKHGEESKILCEYHNLVHKQLENDHTFHVIDDFLYRSGNSKKKYYESIASKEVVRIDNFSLNAEKSYTCVTIASILATNAHHEQLERISEELNVSIDIEKSHKMLPREIEPILLNLEKNGKTREFIFENYCKKNKVMKYIKKQKPKIYK